MTISLMVFVEEDVGKDDRIIRILTDRDNGWVVTLLVVSAVTVYSHITIYSIFSN